jgi:hypothetical protein
MGIIVSGLSRNCVVFVRAGEIPAGTLRRRILILKTCLTRQDCTDVPFGEPPGSPRSHYDWLGFDVRGDVFKIVLAPAPVPDPVFVQDQELIKKKKGPRSDIVVFGSATKYFRVCSPSLDT